MEESTQGHRLVSITFQSSVFLKQSNLITVLIVHDFIELNWNFPPRANLKHK